MSVVDRQILEELILIKWSLIAIFVALAIAILFYLITFAFRVKRKNTDSLLLIRETYIAELSIHESRGEYEPLLEKAEEMARMYPGDAFAIWYSAIGHHKAGQPGAALSCLAELKRVSPAWSTDAVDRFMTEIQSEMDGPRPHSA